MFFEINEVIEEYAENYVEYVEDFLLDEISLEDFRALEKGRKKNKIMNAIYLAMDMWFQQAIEDRDWIFCVIMENNNYEKQREEFYEQIYLSTLEDLGRMYNEKYGTIM